jgi:hypothetical protein
MTRRRAIRSKKSAPAQTADKSRTPIILAAVAIGVIGLGALLYLNVRGPAPIRGLISFPRPSRGHDNALDLPENELPPVGGVHHDIWQNCGIYDEPIPAENVIHSMEHGAVWVTYQPNLDDDEVTQLQDLARGQPFVLLSPYPGLRSPVVLTAWGVQLEVNSAQDNRVEEFIDLYQVGPQTPERGATCENGVGQPIS